MNNTSKIYLAGHRGLVGSALLRRLEKGGYTNIITKAHKELDLTRQSEVDAFFDSVKPEYVFLSAAKVGGIHANSTYPADFIFQNMLIGFNIINAARHSGVKKLMNLGSSCIYPKLAPQPLKEEYLLSGPLESTNDAYALAKIAAIRYCTACNEQYGTNFLSAMPTNLYGPGDNYHPENSHVLPALIRKFHEAKTSGKNNVQLWGDGSPYREFLYSDDLADALVYLMETKNASDLGAFVNIGTGQDLTVKELALLIRNIVYADSNPDKCTIQWDTYKPNGTPKKLLDITRLEKLGWKAQTSLMSGISKAYNDFLITLK